MGLQRKKVTVRTKKGKVYQRSMLVKGTAQQSANRGGRLHSLNPWEARHIEHANTSSVLPADRARMYGSSGPGSDHSAFALMLNGMKRLHATVGHRIVTNDGRIVRDSELGERAPELAAARRKHAQEAAHVYRGADLYGNDVRSEIAHTHGVRTGERHVSAGRVGEHMHADRRGYELAEAFGVSMHAVRAKPPRGGWGSSSEE